jgi:hypothetical protein
MAVLPKTGRGPDSPHFPLLTSLPPPPLPQDFPFEEPFYIKNYTDERPRHEDRNSPCNNGCGLRATAANLTPLGPPLNRVSQSYTRSECGDTTPSHYNECIGNYKGRERYISPAEYVLERQIGGYEPGLRGQ